MAAAAFMVRDGGIAGGHITICEPASILDSSLDGPGDPSVTYSFRGGRMLTKDNYACAWDLYKSIPSMITGGKFVPAMSLYITP